MTSKSKEAYYSRYKSENRWKKNRELKLLRALKRNPGNEAQITEALANMTYRRKKPATKVWTSSMRKTAQLIRAFGGKAHVNLFSTNPNMAREALAQSGNSQAKAQLGEVSFKLGARVRGL